MKRKQAEGSSATKKPKSPVVSTSETSIAYVGEEFTFSHLAAKNYFETSSYVARSVLQYVSQPRVDDVFEAVKVGSCSYGVVRIESSSVGTVYSIYDLLLKHCDDIAIVGEIGEMEKVCVCAKGRITDIDITKVYGRSDMLLASGDYLNAVDQKRLSTGLPMIERMTSAYPATSVAKSDVPGAVALCSDRAGIQNGLEQIHPNVSNDRNSQCRYIVIAKMVDSALNDPLLVGQPEFQSQRKTSIVVALDNSPGAIFKMSSCFALRDIGILKIESRPAFTALSVEHLSSSVGGMSKRHWDLIFYLDIKPSSVETVNEAALRNLGEFSPWFKVLGTYESRLKCTDAAVGESWATLLDVATM